MRIAVVARYFPRSGEPSFGRSAYETLRVLARSNEIRVFYPDPVYPSFLTPPARRLSRLDPHFRPGGIDVEYHSYPALPIVSRPFNGWNIARVLLEPVRAFAPDLIFSIFLYPVAFAALKIGRAIGVPVAAMSIGSDINAIGDPLSRWYTRKVLRNAGALLTVSEDLRRKALAMGAPPSKSRTILNGCDLSVFRPADRAQAREQLGLNLNSELVVYVGRMDVTKGLRELVQAAAILHDHRPRLEVCIVGDGPDKPIIESLIRSQRAGDYIRTFPGCSFDEVSTWITAGDLFALPSYMEGCPNVVLEALACGRPVVATRVGGIPEIMSDSCGRLVPPRDAALLARALGEVLDTTWNPEAIAAQWGRSWNTTAAELFEVFQELLANQGTLAQAR